MRICRTAVTASRGLDGKISSRARTLVAEPANEVCFSASIIICSYEYYYYIMLWPPSGSLAGPSAKGQAAVRRCILRLLRCVCECHRVHVHTFGGYAASETAPNRRRRPTTVDHVAHNRRCVSTFNSAVVFLLLSVRLSFSI